MPVKKLLKATFILISCMVCHQNIAQAMTVEQLYKKCKPFAQNGFDLVPSDPAGGTSCVVYVKAARDIAGSNCYTSKLFRNSGVNIPQQVMNLWAGIVPSNNIFIQEFLNRAEQKPELWDNPATLIFAEVLSNYDCGKYK